MPASGAISGRLAHFKYGDGASSESFTSIGETKTFELNPAGEREFADTTHMNSPSAYREYIPTLRDGGVVTITGNFVYADFATLLAQSALDTTTNYQIVLADSGATTIQFAGYIQGLPMSVPFDGVVSLTITIKVTGPFTDETA